MSDEFFPLPVDPGKRVTELWAWVAVHTNGGEGLVMGDFARNGRLLLITSDEGVAHQLQPFAERAAQSPDVDRLELRRFALS